MTVATGRTQVQRKLGRLDRARRAGQIAWDKPEAAAKRMRSVARAASRIVNVAAILLAFSVLLQEDISRALAVLDSRALITACGLFLAIWLANFIAYVSQSVKLFRESSPIDHTAALLSDSISESCKNFLARLDSDPRAVGSAVELLYHPFLDKRLDDNGWATDQVDVALDPGFVTAPAWALGSLAIGGDDGKKFMLSGFDAPFADAVREGGLKLYVKETRWSAVLRTRDVLSESEELRHAHMKLDPTGNSLPSALCLHVVCLTKDNDFLVLRRAHNSAYYPGAFSVSFEEQLADVDGVGIEGCCTRWFRRALCEEVFPLTGPYATRPRDAWERVSPYVKYMRIWSAFLEEDTANYGLLGVCSLNLSIREFREVSDSVALEFGSTRDPEGRILFSTKDEIETLIRTGSSRCRPVFDLEQRALKMGQLHPSSLYRAALVWSCLV